ncbi:hypothetical protein J2S77_001870 [Alkalibacillus salilacus]|uniref:Uncharacterized protein n=1 Tax=Alkalibacillus salilacus TaxID=284582 RepID=A0ABT9VFX8_9BACI|nr:hypothetical protein [Alkalibacillus salilacus]
MDTAIIMSICVTFLVSMFASGYDATPGEPRK